MSMDPNDGVHGMVPKERMAPAARKLRAFYERAPGAPFYQREFGWYCLDAWRDQGMPQDVPYAELFGFDPPGKHELGHVGWCEAPLAPIFEDKILEDRGDHEVVQDFAGRKLLVFKGRRDGFMPEYIDHPVKDIRSWEDQIAWRLDPTTPSRYADLDERMAEAKRRASEGYLVSQGLVGGYMYLRSLIGPEPLLYAFYEDPDLIHACMKGWLAISDAVIARHQEHVTLDEIFFAEDICYKSGPLISPEMVRRFLFPYYEQLIANVRARQIDPTRHLYVQIDTDGNAPAVIDLYETIGMDVMSPFEVASGCDVVSVGRAHPELAILGGVDKRVLAKGRRAIDEMVDRIFPAMRERGGYVPTCDHGVPAEVPYEDYLYFRRRCLEFA
jgi:hypothetical protein